MAYNLFKLFTKSNIDDFFCGHHIVPQVVEIPSREIIERPVVAIQERVVPTPARGCV